jgi:alpha,alpha-trehalase
MLVMPADSATTSSSNATTSGTNSSEAAVRQLYHDPASGAESGQDFSSRWFADGRNISTIQTTKVCAGV